MPLLGPLGTQPKQEGDDPGLEARRAYIRHLARQVGSLGELDEIVFKVRNPALRAAVRAEILKAMRPEVLAAVMPKGES